MIRDGVTLEQHQTILAKLAEIGLSQEKVEKSLAETSNTFFDLLI